jgi:hypothetical protein
MGEGEARLPPDIGISSAGNEVPAMVASLCCSSISSVLSIYF